ncbi:hypothetical protein GCM10027275_15170 [Rhabdobacter roseus]|uniref:Molybdate transport system regulatory protein n=1 Tax=Rhabdobacter roseus TaxID=1655419 RepID=A0A840TNV8_9BACT|nr:LysR family transcriptional regulator [Rhabdobacter roseus]MBB5283437.1 molybdate transport system regulatory protein [Rhabdobacter roseus]
MEALEVKGSLWLETEAGRFLGPGRVELLQRIEQSGSINKAANQMGMSYKKAWEMVQSMNAQAGTPFVLTQTGGEKGGGAKITPAAQGYIAYYTELRHRFQEFLAHESAKISKIIVEQGT